MKEKFIIFLKPNKYAPITYQKIKNWRTLPLRLLKKKFETVRPNIRLISKEKLNQTDKLTYDK